MKGISNPENWTSEAKLCRYTDTYINIIGDDALAKIATRGPSKGVGRPAQLKLWSISWEKQGSLLL
eukprot:scaffold241_cov89-Cylindrotheca_fusiformis.AAC.15